MNIPPMERYGRTQAEIDGSQADPVADWNSPGGETGLEEPMWQLGLGAGAGAGTGAGAGESYPERPDEADCIYYLRTGFCGYGVRCRFNHPRDRSLIVGAMRTGGGDYPERVGQPQCQYYMRTGMCKFGASCKYHHPRNGGGSVNQVAVNISGYPIRPGEKECSYYAKTGQCKFGFTCKFHHPQPAGFQLAAPVPGPLPAPAPLPPTAMYQAMQSPSVQSSQQYGVVTTGNWPVARSAVLPGSYIPGSIPPVLLSPGMVPYPGWSPYQTPVSPGASAGAQPTVGGGQIYGMTQLSPSAPAYTGPYLSVSSSAGPSGTTQRENAFPERPGQPECQYYLKTGDCKFGPSCKYHHPSEWSTPNMNFVLSPMGLPLRPGTPICSHYQQSGVCRFGPSCKYDHPMGTLSYSPSASSLADMPIAPYPVGAFFGTLAPSSSSSDLRPEFFSGMKAFSSLSVPPSMIFSKGAGLPPPPPLPPSSSQQPAQSPATGSSSRMAGQSSEAARASSSSS